MRSGAAGLGAAQEPGVPARKQMSKIALSSLPSAPTCQYALRIRRASGFVLMMWFIALPLPLAKSDCEQYARSADDSLDVRWGRRIIVLPLL